jgi:hypothetical protein
MIEQLRIVRTLGLFAIFSLVALPAVGDEAEDLSAAFEADLERIVAEQGISDAAATVTTNDDGVTSAIVGVQHLQMLAIRTNDDGTLSYEHVSTAEDIKEFASSDIGDETVAEE